MTFVRAGDTFKDGVSRGRIKDRQARQLRGTYDGVGKVQLGQERLADVRFAIVGVAIVVRHTRIRHPT